MRKRAEVKWSEQPADDDYPAAANYLLLHFDRKNAAKLVKRLRKADVLEFKAVDLFRATGLEFTKSHIDKDRRKIVAGKKISPLLLVRDSGHGKAIIADGYHRLCAVYSLNTAGPIRCKIV
jgi:hypothetical protein